MKLVCPEYKCGYNLKFQLLQTILSADQLAKYNEFNQDLKVVLDSNKVYCPNTACSKVITCNKNKSKMATCEHCKH